MAHKSFKLSHDDKNAFSLWLGVACVAALVFGIIHYVQGSELRTMARSTCADMSILPIIALGPTLSRSIGRVEQMGYTAQDLGDALRDECPDLMQSYEAWADNYRNGY